MIHDMDSKIERRRESSFLDRYKILDSMPISKLDNALANPVNKKDDKDVAIWLVIYMLSKFFFANSSSSVSWNVINLAQDNNWSKMLLKHLEKRLNKSNENPTYLSGRFPLIMYWVAEMTQICERVAARKGYAYPLTFAH